MQTQLCNKLLSYYVATVIYLALDVLFAINVRLSFLETMSGWRAAYYLFCIDSATLMHRRPVITVLVSGIEGMIRCRFLVIESSLG